MFPRVFFSWLMMMMITLFFYRDGRYGLYLDESLFDGSSAWCVTFENDPLCSPGPDKAGAVAFECVGLEVWAVGP